MSRLLDPKILMTIKDLSLAAKTTVDGFMTGIHNSNIKGAGMEFSQYRSYQPGDDLRSLDWKMFARSDRYYIRESEIETSISVRFLLDASASMNHRDGNFTKMEFAKYVAASLAYLSHLQGDAIGLYLFREGDLFSLPARKDHQHLTRLLHQLEHIQAGGKFTEAIHYRNIFLGNQKRELLVFITDFYQQDNEITKMLELVSSLRHEVIVLHIMAENEMEFDYKGYTILEDLETKQAIKIDAQQTNKLYKQRLDEYLATIRTQLLDRNIFYRLIKMNQPMDTTLRDFLKQRNNLKI
ncbi:MAG: DUF58 domain-containing protein [Ginsengibacter sp.]